MESNENLYKDFTLLVDGKNSFVEILNCINNAKKSIDINMFIWRDDEIGNKVAKACLDAANRGVKVNISVDRYGVVLEKVEESKKSFFHKQQKLSELVKINFLKMFYPKGNKKYVKDEYSELYKLIMNHENISVSEDIFKADHSKYYIIDNSIVFLGGVNIEDKENGIDMDGKEYQDYMIKISGSKHVEAFLEKLNNGINVSEEYFFGINLKKKKNSSFEMENLYLEMIKNSKKELRITMAYFSNVNSIIEELIKAYNRGVKITIMISESSNFQDDINKRTIAYLMKKTNNEIDVYFSKKRIHTKLIVSDDYISLGSTNITKKAFNQLNELNLFVKNVKSDFKDSLVKSMEENYKLAKKIESYKDIKYSKTRAFIEGLVI